MINHNNDKDSFNYSFWMARGCAGGDTARKNGAVGIRPDYSNNRQVIIHPHTLISSEEPLCHSCIVQRLTKAPFWALNAAHLQRNVWFDAKKRGGGAFRRLQALNRWWYCSRLYFEICNCHDKQIAKVCASVEGDARSQASLLVLVTQS